MRLLMWFYRWSTLVSIRMSNEWRLSVHNWCVDNWYWWTLHFWRVWLSYRTSRLQIRRTWGKAVLVYIFYCVVQWNRAIVIFDSFTCNIPNRNSEDRNCLKVRLSLQQQPPTMYKLFVWYTFKRIYWPIGYWKVLPGKLVHINATDIPEQKFYFK